MTELAGADLRGALTDRPAGRGLEELGDPLEVHLTQHATWVTSAAVAGRQLDISGYDMRMAGVLDEVNLNAVIANNSVWCGLDLTRAQLAAGQFADSDFRFTVLRGADLRGADLQRARLRNARLAGANLRAFALENGKLLPTRLRGADLR